MLYYFWGYFIFSICCCSHETVHLCWTFTARFPTDTVSAANVHVTAAAASEAFFVLQQPGLILALPNYSQSAALESRCLRLDTFFVSLSLQSESLYLAGAFPMAMWNCVKEQP